MGRGHSPIFINTPNTTDGVLDVSLTAADANNPLADSFGRFRVSEPLTLFASKQLYDNSPLFFDQVEGGTGAGSFTSGESRVDMTTAADADYVIRQSKQRMDYQPGKSQRIFCTFTASQETNLTKRIGYFSSSISAPYTANRDGLYLEITEDNIYICVFKNGTEKARVQKSDWNVNSEVSIDWTKSQIFVMDFEWLGVGGVRFGFVIDGAIIPVHRYNHSNRDSGVYMQFPNQPIRYEMRQSGAGSGTLSHICAEVESEGGQEELGTRSAVTTGTSSISMANSSNIYAIAGIRLKSTHLATTILPRDFSAISVGNDDMRIIFGFNPTLSAAGTWNDQTNSAVQTNIAPGGTVTDTGRVIAEYFLTPSSGVDAVLDSAIKLGSDIDGTRDTLWMMAQAFTNSASVAASFNWTEL